MPVQKVLIVGAGIAGLSAAITLARQGKDVSVVERSTVNAAGASITLVNRGPDALRDLGVLDACMAEAYCGKNESLYDDIFMSDGTRLPVPRVPVRSDDIPSYILIFRPILARILAEAARNHGADVTYGRGVDGFHDDGSGVDVTFDDQQSDRYDLVVAADGASSRSRVSLFADKVTPAYHGRISLRLVKPNMPAGPGGFYGNALGDMVVVHELSGGLTYFATDVLMENRRVSQAEAFALCRDVFSRFESPFIRALSADLKEDDPIIARPYLLHMLPKPWHKGRVVVIGDAAHTMSPHIASGGVMSMEDGLVLGEELARADELDTVLTSFADRRYDRTFLAVDACRKMLELHNSRGDPAGIAKLRSQTFAELLKPY